MIPKASIIILTKNVEKNIGSLLSKIYLQEYKLFEVIIIDSSSKDNTLKIAKKYPVRVVNIEAKEFGHGKTRNLGARLAKGKIIIYITQDAIPVNEKWLTNLIHYLGKRSIVGVFGRQIPRSSSNPLDFFNHQEDYPNRRKELSINNYKQQNVIFSDVNSAIIKSILNKYPFPNNILVSEDLGWAVNVIKKGYKILYEPSAAVIHSHNFNLLSTFKTNFDHGVSFNQIFKSRNSAFLLHNSKTRFINKVKYLIKGYKFHWALITLIVDITKLIAVSLGKNHRSIPVIIKKALSNYPNYWNKFEYENNK